MNEETLRRINESILDSNQNFEKEIKELLTFKQHCYFFLFTAIFMSVFLYFFYININDFLDFHASFNKGDDFKFFQLVLSNFCLNVSIFSIYLFFSFAEKGDPSIYRWINSNLVGKFWGLISYVLIIFSTSIISTLIISLVTSTFFIDHSFTREFYLFCYDVIVFIAVGAFSILGYEKIRINSVKNKNSTEIFDEKANQVFQSEKNIAIKTRNEVQTEIINKITTVEEYILLRNQVEYYNLRAIKTYYKEIEESLLKKYNYTEKHYSVLERDILVKITNENKLVININND